ncbi:MAG: VIT domain-containing protein [bacterium]
MRFSRSTLALLVGAGFSILALPGCGKEARPQTQSGAAVATLHVVRPEVSLTQGGVSALARWQTRVGAGATVSTTTGRAWIRHDHGLRVLLGPGSSVRVFDEDVQLVQGTIWVEAPAGPPSAVTVGTAVVSASRAGFELRVAPGGPPRLYVARGRAEVRQHRRLLEIRAGERATLGRAIKVDPEHLWDDWTGGLAWPAPDVPEAPAGMGQIGARRPGTLGRASFPLAVRSLDIKTRIDKDLATTVVDQVFFNPASDDLEGVYRIRVPRGAILEAFCIDRPALGTAKLVCGYVKEKQTARAQYRAQVYEGSRDDPALLEWEAPGQYKAHIYPIKAGSTRRVVLLYTEWVHRQGDVRRWHYPMGGSGTAAPLIQEFNLEVDLDSSGAKKVEAGMGAAVQQNTVVLRRSDFRPRADFVLALHGGGNKGAARGYASRGFGKDGPYLMVRLRPTELERAGRREGLDLVVVVDTSADTDPTELQLARTTVDALLRHLGPGDRVAVLGADLALHQPGGGKARLAKVTPALIEASLDALARQGVGGATDLGQVLTDAAGLLQSGRGGAVVYVGDGIPTVGEMRAKPLLLRLNRLATPVRVYGMAVGNESNLALLESLARHQGGLALRVSDRAHAAAAALKVVAHASRPTMSKVAVDLGPTVERVFPGQPVSVVAGMDLVVLGRLRGRTPTSISVTGWYQGKETKRRYDVRTIKVADKGELRRRWATARLHQLIATGSGREEVAELGTRFGLITEHTSIYVPSAREARDNVETRNKVREANERLKQELTEREEKRTQRAREGRTISRVTETQQKTPTAEPAADADDEKSADKRAAAKPSAAAPATSAGEGMAPPSRRYKKSRRSRSRSGALNGLFDSAADPAKPASKARPSRRPSGSTTIVSKGLDQNARVMIDRSRDGGGSAGTLTLSSEKSGLARGLGDRGVGGKDAFKGRLAFGAGGRSGSGQHRLDVHVYIHQDKLHKPKNCSAASTRPLHLRSILWQERLRQKQGIHGVAEVWTDALRHCEARRWRDRRTLLQLMLNTLGNVQQMTGFARRYRRYLSGGEWAYLRRAIFARTRTARDLQLANRLFHGGRALDWTMVKTLLAKLKTDADRIRELLTLVAVYPKNVRLKLMALDLLEGANRHAEAERLCTAVAGNPYADARLRTAVGEFWARRGRTARAKRIFSEIVEFRPTDPLARRRLGDLYRAFGWYHEAYRQYQTLAALAPHDTSVLLLMALAAAGTGRIDEALRLEQRVAASATGSGGAARWALLWSSVRLALLRAAAEKKGDKLLLAKLVARTRRSGVLRHARKLRVILTWSHPEADIELWGAHPGWRPQRAEELAPQFGIEAFAVRKPKPGRYLFEVRRVGRVRPRTLRATLYVLWDEGGPQERLQKFPLELLPTAKSLRFAITGRKAEELR